MILCLDRMFSWLFSMLEKDKPANSLGKLLFLVDEKKKILLFSLSAFKKKNPTMIVIGYFCVRY